jgi:hypothetical protein
VDPSIVRLKSILSIVSQTKIISLGDTKYHIIVGASGGCTVSINIGGKVFRSNFNELNQGLLDVDASEYFTVLKRPDNLIKMALKQQSKKTITLTEPGRTTPLDTFQDKSLTDR